MCTSGDSSGDDGSESGSSSSTGPDGGEDYVFNAPRLGLDPDVMEQIDWAEVARITVIGTAGGATKGMTGAVSAGISAGAIAVEAQPNVNLSDLFQINYDMIYIPGLPGPYVPLY